ncbi:MAG: hypothetical protein M0036_26280 [Desulfobacteraceae bacterium]|nr:hypothetical protein [Desulfobacteraceae bacterium]
MNRFRIKGLIIAAVVLLLAVGAGLFAAWHKGADRKAPDVQTKSDDRGNADAEQSPEGAPDKTPGPISISDASKDQNLRQAVTKQIITSKLVGEYGATIRHPRIQLQAIQMLINELKQIYPDTWRDHLQEFLLAAFPDLADELYARFLKLEEYQQWVATEYKTLLNMPARERNQYLMEKRKQFFGEEAALIWAKELQAQQVADALEELNQLKQAPFEDKLKYYQSRLEDIYADQTEAYTKKNPQKVMDQFLSSESVQEDLANMSEEQRRQSLNNFRRSVGLDDTALQRWSELDAARDERWRAGQAYMRQREQIVTEFQGDQQAEKLDALRKELFGAEAATIKDEEQAGFFRFNTKRIYGQN